jgi:hypothetical protein
MAAAAAALRAKNEREAALLAERVAAKHAAQQGGEVLINRSTYQMKPFYLSKETVLPIK